MSVTHKKTGETQLANISCILHLSLKARKGVESDPFCHDERVSLVYVQHVDGQDTCGGGGVCVGDKALYPKLWEWNDTTVIPKPHTGTTSPVCCDEAQHKYQRFIRRLWFRKIGVVCVFHQLVRWALAVMDRVFRVYTKLRTCWNSGLRTGKVRICKSFAGNMNLFLELLCSCRCLENFSHNLCLRGTKAKTKTKHLISLPEFMWGCHAVFLFPFYKPTSKACTVEWS